jgi:hypothetical protein
MVVTTPPEMGSLGEPLSHGKLSALLGGAAAGTEYMLADRDNWYMSPVNEQEDACGLTFLPSSRK